MEELEIPYALNNGQNANSSDDSDGGYCSPSSRKRKKRTEPLRPGDLIEYTCPIFVAGSRQGRRTAIVLSTDPSQKKYPIVLNNAELLSRDVHIKRIGEYLNGDLTNEPMIPTDPNYSVKSWNLNSNGSKTRKKELV